MSHGGINGWWMGPSSMHPGGINSVMADGSVHFLSVTMDWNQYDYLNGVAEGKTVTLN
jgi:prepilin-type processing-associated H-X9-DG protein